MKILIVRLSSIGDIVHTLPALVALRRHFPDARIDWLVESRFRDILLDNPQLDELLEIDTLGWRDRPTSRAAWAGMLGMLRTLRARRYDVVLDIQGTLKSSVFAFMARGERRIGFAKRELREPLARLFPAERFVPRATKPHVVYRNLALLAALGIETEEAEFPIAIPESLEEEADRALARLGISSYVALNPGASWRTKRWSPEKFGELAAQIRAEQGLASLVMWGPAEREIADRVVRHSKEAAILAPQTSVREMLPYLRRARLLVSGDTGPLHIAAALGVRVIGIYGPTIPARNGPFGTDDPVISKSVPCGPCHKRRCPGFDNVCLESIEVSEVHAALAQVLQDQTASASPSFIGG